MAGINHCFVANGTLKVGDIVVAGTSYGRIKAMFNERNQRIDQAGPAEPAIILGLNGAPTASDTFHIMETEQEARDITNKRVQLQSAVSRSSTGATSRWATSLRRSPRLRSSRNSEEIKTVSKSTARPSCAVCCKGTKNLHIVK